MSEVSRMTYTIYVCPECGATFTEAYSSHGKRGDYPVGRRPQCDGGLEAVEVVRRALADGLANAVADIVEPLLDTGSEYGRAVLALAQYREAVE